MEPIAVAAVVDVVREWLAQPSVTILYPGPEHAKALSSILAALGTGGNLTTNAHLASLVIEFRRGLPARRRAGSWLTGRKCGAASRAWVSSSGAKRDDRAARRRWPCPRTGARFQIESHDFSVWRLE